MQSLLINLTGITDLTDFTIYENKLTQRFTQIPKHLYQFKTNLDEVLMNQIKQVQTFTPTRKRLCYSSY